MDREIQMMGPVRDWIYKRPGHQRRLLKLARRFSRFMHRGQVRNDGEPYFKHPERVASKFQNPELKIIAYLHDIPEDTGFPIYRIRDVFGIFVGDHIARLTKYKGEDYGNYIKGIAWPETKLVKLADIMDNLMDSPSYRQKCKYEAALRDLMELENFSDAYANLRGIGKYKGRRQEN